MLPVSFINQVIHVCFFLILLNRNRAKASRILDPIFVGVDMDAKTESNIKRKKEYGKFYKDYKETEW